MTHEEAMAAVKAGRRVESKFSQHKECVEPCKYQHGTWRTLTCNYDTDVVECYACGMQKIAKCNFEDEYS